MRTRQLYLVAAAALAGLALTAPVRAELLINIDKSAQQMTVTEDGVELHVWPVSTGGAGYDTPNGEWKPFRMEKDHFSREWDDAPMPNSIFFTMEGHAIHGTYEVKNLGKPVSHGCVRLSRANSDILWRLVKKNKMANTKVVLTGEIPGGPGVPVARRTAPRQQQQAQDYERYYSTDDLYADDEPPPRPRGVVRGWREYNDGPRYYYERERPYVERRYYRAGSDNGPLPFPFLFGR